MSATQDAGLALKELQERYDQLAQQHHLLSIRFVHRTFLLQSAARMLEAETYPDLWREVEDILAGMGGLPVFWVVAYPQAGPLFYSSTEARNLETPVKRPVLDQNLSLPDAGNGLEAGEAREVALEEGGTLACLRFRAVRGGLAIYGKGEQGLAHWRTERELVNAVRAILPSAIEGISRRQIAAEAAMRDPLTGLLNRREFSRRFEQELARCGRAGVPLSVVMLDLDHFKKINDNYGHLQGDLVLREVADRLVRALRIPDVVGRYGGEEYVILLPECGVDDASQVAERLREALAAEPVARLDGEGVVQVTGSFGVSSPGIVKNHTVEEIIQRADHALYRAKHEGRNRVVVAPVEPV